jgi:4-diphosphocytidyl-2-C-methyl-D-erythritol kinase
MRPSSTKPRAVTAFAAAKVNIGLHVGARRADGYHDVCGLVQTVSLFDRLRITAGGSAGLTVRVPGHPDLESGENLVVAAARALAEFCEPRPVEIEIEKAIPVAAGLGGGSADAAAALAALNVVWGGGLRAGRLLEIAAQVGSDVPAILLGGLVHISGRGELVRGVGSANGGAFVLGVGTERIAAADAYTAFDDVGAPAGDGVERNDLEPAAFRIVPALAGRVDAMRGAGAHPVFVSGSGPTVVGVASGDAAAREIASRAAATFDRVEVVKPTTWGVRILVGDAAGAPIH